MGAGVRWQRAKSDVSASAPIIQYAASSAPTEGQRVPDARAQIDRSTHSAARAERCERRGQDRETASVAMFNQALLGSRATELGRAQSVALP
jgi:hypothetical protein